MPTHRKPVLLFPGLLLLALKFMAGKAEGAIYFVATTGNDANTGTSQDAAWATIAYLRSAPVVWTEIPPPYQTNGTNLSFQELPSLWQKFYRLYK